MNKEPNVFLLVLLGNAMLAVVFALSFYYAFAFSIMWGWFAVPIFHAPALSPLHAWGLILMLGLTRFKLDLEKKNTDGMASGWFGSLAAPLVALGIGYMVRP